MRPLVSVIIATFNSEKLLPLVLRSIRRQKFPRGKLEIIVIDGGSRDKTLNIAKKFGCRIIKNPRTEPIFGKFLGFKKAKGKYLIFLDHDEVLLSKHSVEYKLKAITDSIGVKAVAGSGYKNPKGYPTINCYINEFGDPFSFFIYRLTKDARFFIKVMRKRYPTTRDKREYAIFDLSGVIELPIIELVAGGTMIDSGFFKKEFPSELKKIYFLGQAFNLMCKRHPYLAITKNDILLHYSSNSLKGYLKKIRWRIKNNIYFASYTGKAGYTGRERYLPPIIKYKKYLFIIYVLTIIGPLIDSLHLMITRKNMSYILHLPLSIYTGLTICFYFIYSKIGPKPKLKSYDESIVAGS